MAFSRGTILFLRWKWHTNWEVAYNVDTIILVIKGWSRVPQGIPTDKGNVCWWSDRSKPWILKSQECPYNTVTVSVNPTCSFWHLLMNLQLYAQVPNYPSIKTISLIIHVHLLSLWCSGVSLVMNIPNCTLSVMITEYAECSCIFITVP